MFENYEATIKNIQPKLNLLSLNISSGNASGDTSLSKYAESYFIPILNTLIEGSPFEVMDVVNATTIDLKNDSASVQIQVSSENSINNKITKTLKKPFVASSKIKKPRLIFLFIAAQHTQVKKEETKNKLNQRAASKGYDFQFERDVIELSEFSILLVKIYEQKKDGFKKIEINDLEYIEQYLEGTTGLEKYLYRRQKKAFREGIFDASASEISGRERDLEELSNFYNQEEKKVFILAAEPGMGKTSLCYKFFEENNLDPFFFNESSATVIKELENNELFNQRKTLFFIDDLQNDVRKESFMDTLSRLANAKNNKAKFIITLRSENLLPKDSNLIGEGHYARFRRELVSEYQLGRLSDDTVRNIISGEINDSLDKDSYVSSTVKKIEGVPILLKHFIKCLREGKDLNTLTLDSQESHLVALVKGYIREIKETWRKESSELKDETLDQIVFLAALQNEIDVSELDSLFSKISQKAINSILQRFFIFVQKVFSPKISQKTINLVPRLVQRMADSSILFERRGEKRYRISPELFRDAILVYYFTENLDHIESFFLNLLNDAGRSNGNDQEHLKSILGRLAKLNNENLNSYKIGENTLSEIINKLKDEVFFKKKISNAGELYSLESKLKILSSIAYRDPVFVLDTLKQLYFEQFSNNEFFLNTIKNDFNSLKDLQETIKEQFQIIILNACDRISLDNSYELLMKYFKLFNNNLSFMEEAFRYLHYDFNEYGYYREKPLLRQKYFLDKLEKKLKELDSSKDQDNDFSFIYSGLQVLLGLECKPYSYYDSDRAYWYNHLWVYPSRDLTEIRTRATTGTQTLLRKIAIDEKKKIVIYKFLLHEFWFIKTHSRKENSPLDRVSELNQLFDFFLNELREFPSIELKAAILNTFRLYKDDEIKKEFFDKKSKLVSLAKDTKDNQEKLALFCSNEYLILDSDLDNQIKELIDSFPDIYKFIDTLIQAIEYCETKESYLSNGVIERITNYLQNRYTDQAKEIYDYIYANYNSHKYRFIDILVPFFSDEDFFYSLIEKLWNPDDIQSHGYLSWMLLHGRGSEIFKKEDLNYFQIMLSKKNRTALTRMSFSIYKYFDLSFPKTRKLIEKIWKLAEKDPSYSDLKQHILSFLFKDKNLNKKFKNKLKLFIEKFFMSRINPFDEDSWSLLNFIENYYGFEELLSLTIKIIKQNPKARAVFQSYENKNKSEEESVKHYIKVLDFYLSQNIQNINNRYSYHNLLGFFSPYEISSFYEQQVSNVLLSELNNYFDLIKGEDINKAKELLSFLTSRFYVDEKLCDFLVKAAIHIEKNLSEENLSAELTLIFNEEFLKNRGLTRRRLPQEEVYPADLEKRKVLENIINKYQPKLTDSRVLDFLKTALRNVGYDLEK